ncbi:MAG: hypothetical protein R2795_08310 [Saprospiraceae bacterium]
MNNKPRYTAKLVNSHSDSNKNPTRQSEALPTGRSGAARLNRDRVRNLENGGLVGEEARKEWE